MGVDELLNGPEDNEGSFVEGLNVDGPEDDEGLLEEGLNVDGPDVTEGGSVDVVENVGGVMCPWQLPLLIETSSIAKSPVTEDPAIPSNVT